MEVTGAAELLARQVLHVGDIFESPHTRAMVVLAGLYILTATLTEVMSNNAAIVLLAPIAISIGHALGMDPRPFVIAATVGASAAFATPIGYQTNTYVYGVGNYRFGDFVKIGLPLNIVYFIGCMIIIPMFWKF
jgi:di/tricarboxylate transporter